MATTPTVQRGHGGFVLGALQQLLNELTARAHHAIGPLPDVPMGDVLEPVGDGQRAGADAVERWVEGLLGDRRDIDPQAARATRPLLAQHALAGHAGGAPTVLHDEA
ncbi:MAG: hypothetical protein JWM98_2385, partial [Thermoleophilia bacterium]|nr:hypothetical protein [Thermoleophilia bacterium]